MKKYIILLSFFFCFQFNDSFAVNSIHANQLEHFETQTQKKSIIKKWISKVYRNNPESKFATYFNKHIASTIFAVLGILFVGIGGTIYLVFNRMFNGESVILQMNGS